MRNLSVYGFWYLWGSGNQSPQMPRGSCSTPNHLVFKPGCVAFEIVVASGYTNNLPLVCYNAGIQAASQNPNIKGTSGLLSLKRGTKSPLHKHLPNTDSLGWRGIPLKYILRLAPSPSSVFTSLWLPSHQYVRGWPWKAIALVLII